MLVKVYRLTLLPGDFNRNCVFFMGLNGFICGLLMLVWLCFLNKYTNDRQAFVKCYIIIQIITLIFEYPAIMSLRKVRFLEEQTVPEKRDSFWSGLVAVIRHREFLIVLLLLMLHGLYLGGLSAYVVVYLLRVWKLNPLLITIVSTFFVFMAVVSVMKFGKLSERLNYPRFMLFGSLLMFVLALLWCFNLDSIWINIIFLFLIFDGARGVATFVIFQIQSAIPAALAPKQFCEVYIAYGTLARSIGATTGSWIAGMIFGLGSGSEYDKFRNVFLAITVFPALMILFSLLWMKMTKKKSSGG